MFLILCHRVVRISMVQLLLVITIYICCFISVVQLPFLFPHENFRLHFELSPLAVPNHFKFQQILKRLSFIKVVALRLHEPDPNCSVLSILYPMASF